MDTSRVLHIRYLGWQKASAKFDILVATPQILYFKNAPLRPFELVFILGYFLCLVKTSALWSWHGKIGNGRLTALSHTVSVSLGPKACQLACLTLYPISWLTICIRLTKMTQRCSPFAMAKVETQRKATRHGYTCHSWLKSLILLVTENLSLRLLCPKSSREY